MVVRDDVHDPEPEFGQVLVQVKACGICGSDLHFAKHGATMLALGQEMEGMPDMGRVQPDLGRDIFMGHEFSAEVLEVGPDTIGPKPGTLVTSIPAMLTLTGVKDLVYSNDLPAGYSERMLLSAPMLLEVPNGLGVRSRRADRTHGRRVPRRESFGHRTRRRARWCSAAGRSGSRSSRRSRSRGVAPIVASDYSPARRALAHRMGAHVAVDPAEERAFDAWAREGGGRPLVVFEAIGVPGIIDEALRSAPPQARIVVVGVCMERDAITPFFAIGKELNLQFVLGYDPMEFEATLRSIAEGEVDVEPMITGRVGLDGVPDAFRALANPDEHCKILVTP